MLTALAKGVTHAYHGAVKFDIKGYIFEFVQLM
jgi:hypothetical protein